VKYWEQGRKFERKTNMAAVIEEIWRSKLASSGFLFARKDSRSTYTTERQLKQLQFTLALALKGCDVFKGG